MTISLSFLATHFVADFLLQSDWMALNKSKWNESVEGFNALLFHCVIYGACFLWMGIDFAVVTLILHFLTDAITSKITSKLWFMPTIKTTGGASYVMKSDLGVDIPVYEVTVTKDRHWFFVVIGFDQLIHYFALVGVNQWFQ